MNIDTSTKTASQLAEWTAFEAVMAKLAIEGDAKAENSKHVAALTDYADAKQQAEHIRGVVAATVSQISINATSATQDNTAVWQTWALGLANSLDHSAVD